MTPAFLALCLLCAVADPIDATAPPTSAPAASPKDIASLSAAEWATDLDAWVAGILDKHVEPFRHCPRDRFEAAVAALRAKLPALSSSQTLVEFARLAALLGDSHTVLGLDRFAPLFRPLPVRFACLDDGVFVIASTPEHKELLGAKLVAIGGTSIDEVVARAITLAPADNRGAALEAASGFGYFVEALEALEVIPAGSASVSVTVAAPTATDPTATRVVALSPLAAGARPPLVVVGEGRRETDAPISFLRRPGSAWFEPVPQRNAVYFRYNACVDGKPPMAELARDAVAAWRALAVDGKAPRFVIDLRDNGGGNSAVLRPLLDALADARRADPALRGERSVVALIGPRTRSSASMNALELKQRVGALLIGQSTGQRINHLGEMRTFNLPNSGLRATYSTKYFRHDPTNDADGVIPDVIVPRTSVELMAQRDAALDEALR